MRAVGIDFDTIDTRKPGLLTSTSTPPPPQRVLFWRLETKDDEMGARNLFVLLLVTLISQGTARRNTDLCSMALPAGMEGRTLLREVHCIKLLLDDGGRGKGWHGYGGFMSHEHCKGICKHHTVVPPNRSGSSTWPIVVAPEVILVALGVFLLLHGIFFCILLL